jgi:uracil-DNA glycosylase family 4
MPFDPTTLGARCDVCPLGPEGHLRKDEWKPVGCEVHKGASILAVAESPEPEEVQHGRPLVGRSGSEWNRALAACGKRRTDIDLDHVIACRLPGQASGAMRRLDKAVDKLNRKRVKEGQEAVPHPTTCCRPRLLHMADRYPSIITLGKTATHALTNVGSSIQATRGGPMRVTHDWGVTTEPEETAHRLLPTLHPSFILRSPSWRRVLHSDLGKAFRWFTDTLQWTQPDTLWRPTPNQLEEWLKQKAPFWAYDVETDGIEPMECRLRTIAIATPDLDERGRAAEGKPAVNSKAVGISLLSADGRTHFYLPEDEWRIKDILRAAFTDGRVWVGHNAGSYDRMVIENHLQVNPYPLVDTLFPARFRAPDLPKGLKTIGSILTDVERWETTEKGSSIATGSTDDDELLKYNIIDTVVNARITLPLIRAATNAGAFNGINENIKPASWPCEKPWNLNEVDHETQVMCVEMHKNGVWVDQKQRRDLEARFSLSVKKREKRLDELAPGINPGSYDQIRDLFYSKWNLGIPPQMDVKDFYTETGAPGTGDAVLRAHIASGNLSEEQEVFVRELRLYRREKNKILGTVLIPLNRRDIDPKKGVVWEDGRVRPSWNAHVTSVARLSCSGPNLQNIGNRKGQGPLKTIFAAPPGYILIGADLDQAHLRIIANYWKIPLLMECFEQGKDPHNTLAHNVFGERFEQASGWGEDGFSLYSKPAGGDAKSMRDVCKTLRYASAYAADPATVWQVLTSTETDDAKLPYVGMTLREVRVMHDTWKSSEPEWQKAWDLMKNVYDRQGYMSEPIMGRRSGPLSDGKLQEVVNFPILAAEGSTMRLAEAQVREAFPFEYAGLGTGMIHQCHDSICVQAPLPKGFDPMWTPTKGEPLPPEIEKMKRTMEEAMTIKIPGWPVAMTAEADVGRTLKDV